MIYIFQILTSAFQELKTAVLMLYAIITRDHTTVLVYLDILEMDGFARVTFCVGSFLFRTF